MINRDFKKEIFRFVSIFILVYLITLYFFNSELLNEGNRTLIKQNISRDIFRFFGLAVNQNTILEQSIFIFSILITLFISSSFWFNNPYLYKESNFLIYLKLYSYLSFFTIFVFYFLRIINISRLYFLIYLFIISFVFLLFRSQGLISTKIIRESILKNFLHIKIGDGYGNEIYFDSMFEKSNEKDFLNFADSTTDNINETVTSYQRSSQFDFILINIEKLTEPIVDSIFELMQLNKPIVLLITQEHLILKSDLSFRKISNNKFNLYFINTKVQTGFEFILKRLMDCTVSVISLFILSPLIVFCSFFIFMQDYKSPFIGIYRSGLYGKEFKMYKFRTMYSNAHEARSKLDKLNERSGPLFKIKDDPRIIKKLSWIRKYSIDEIPQFLNVLKGDMSVVGPRPLFKEDLKKFTNQQTVRMSVLPGITGLLQINEREAEDFSTWYKYDKEYIDRWSLLMDIKIILLTPISIIKSQ